VDAQAVGISRLLGLVAFSGWLLLWRLGGSFRGSSIRSLSASPAEVAGLRSGGRPKRGSWSTIALARHWARGGGLCLSILVFVAPGICDGGRTGLSRCWSPCGYDPLIAGHLGFHPVLIIYFGLGELPKFAADLHRHPLLPTLMIMDAVQVRARELLESAAHNGWAGVCRSSPRWVRFHRSPGADAIGINMGGRWIW